MARSVADCAFLLAAMAGPDARVPISLAEPGATFAAPLERDFRGVRVAWAPTLGGLPVDPAVRTALEASLAHCAALGLEVEEDCPDLADAEDIFRTLRAWQFAARFGPDLELHRAQMKDTVVWNIEAGLALSVADLSRAETRRSLLIERVAAFFERYAFLLCPVTQVPPFPVEQEWVREIGGEPLATYLDWMASCYRITVTGCPALSVPAAFTATGLPVGLQIVGPRWQDFAVLQLGHAFERAAGASARRPPLLARV